MWDHVSSLFKPDKLGSPLDESTSKFKKWPSFTLVTFFALISTLSDINITTPAFFWLVLEQKSFSIIYFKLFVSIYCNVLLASRIWFHLTFLYDMAIFSSSLCYLDHLHLMWSLIWLSLNLSSCYLFFICFICALFSFPLFLILVINYFMIL